MRLKMFVAPILFAALAASMAIAQGPPTPASVDTGVGDGELPLPGAKAGIVTMRMEDIGSESVKGAPFCATVNTEHTQAFADGNRIHSTDNSSLCRDSEGRTRREAGLNLLGAAPQNSAPKLITIVDPVAGFRYMLDTENKTAHRMAITSPSKRSGGVTVGGPAAVREKGGQVMLYQHVGTAGPNMVANDNVFFKKAGQASDEPAPASENLGDQTIDGIHATGTRMTTTIPAGKMGNELAILVTSERWYSPELKATIMTKHSDPWAGELKTQFTNVKASEPDPSLFSVPDDYKVVDDKEGPFMIQKRVLAPPPPPQ